MLCQVCNKSVKTRRTIQRFFKVETHHICERCYRKHPISPSHRTIPIEEGVMQLTVLVQHRRRTSPLAHMSFLKPYIIHHVCHNRDHLLLYVDEIDETIMQTLDLLKLGHLHVIALYENRVEKKENNHEI